MIKTCWCRKKLVEGYVKGAGRDHPARGCRVHGEDFILPQETVAAFVEAVKAADEWRGLDGDGIGDPVRALLKAAFAMLPKGEEKHG